MIESPTSKLGYPSRYLSLKFISFLFVTWYCSFMHYVQSFTSRTNKLCLQQPLSSIIGKCLSSIQGIRERLIFFFFTFIISLNLYINLLVIMQYSCSRGVHGTPTFFVNGFGLADASSPLGFKGWKHIIDPLILDKGQRNLGNLHYFLWKVLGWSIWPLTLKTLLDMHFLCCKNKLIILGQRSMCVYIIFWIGVSFIWSRNKKTESSTMSIYFFSCG